MVRVVRFRVRVRVRGRVRVRVRDSWRWGWGLPPQHVIAVFLRIGQELRPDTARSFGFC